MIDLYYGFQVRIKAANSSGDKHGKMGKEDGSMKIDLLGPEARGEVPVGLVVPDALAALALPRTIRGGADAVYEVRVHP
jgi:hypothetical protein